MITELSSDYEIVAQFSSSPQEIGHFIEVPDLPDMLAIFIYDQIHPDNPIDNGNLPSPEFYLDSSVSVFPSAVAHFFAPSDNSGVGGMRRERIRATTSWRRGPARNDCILAQKDAAVPGMEGLHAARVRLFMSFVFRGKKYPCALVQWFSHAGNAPDEETGMWVVEPDFNDDGTRFCSVIHINTIMRGAHLIPAYGPAFIPPEITFANSLDAFRGFYVSKFADYHAHQTVF